MGKICIAGKNIISVNAVKYLLEKKNIKKSNIIICVNKNDDGIDGWQPSLKKFANDNGLSIVKLEDLYTIENLVFFSLEFDRLIKPQLFKSKKLFNIHFSLLPKYKGMYTSVWPLLNGDRESGVTLHKIDTGIDTGDIIDQKKFKIGIQETCRDLYFKYLKYGESLFNEIFEKLVNENYRSYAQELHGSYYSRDSINFEKIEIDLYKTSYEIHNQIRAYTFKEYQLPKIRGFEIKQSTITQEKINRNAFKVLKDRIELSGIDGFKLVLSIN